MNQNRREAYSANIKSYDVLSTFYQQLVLSRGHYDKQLSILQTTIAMEGLSCSGRLLDAACGTGDVARSLFERGFHGIDALDGSQAMLNHAREKASPIAFECIDWAELSSYFSRKPPYDLIFLLGNSLAHLPTEFLPTVLQNLYTGLSNGGTLLLDLRPWERNVEGLLREPGRPPEIFRFLGKISIQDEEFWLDELTSYDRQKQTVRYRLRPLPGGSTRRMIDTTVSYYLFDHEKVKELLSSVGFQSSNIETRKFLDWSYLVVVARK